MIGFTLHGTPWLSKIQCERSHHLQKFIYPPGSDNLKAKWGLSPAHTLQATHKIKKGGRSSENVRVRQGTVIGCPNYSVWVDRSPMWQIGGWEYGGGQTGGKLKGYGGVVSLDNDLSQFRGLASKSNKEWKTGEHLLVCLMVCIKQNHPESFVFID